MTPEAKARENIDKKLEQSGWTLQDMKDFNPMASLGVAVREYPTSTGPVDYALFIDRKPVGIIEAKSSEKGETLTTAEEQTSRYASSTFKWANLTQPIRFAYEATDIITRFTDYADNKSCSREVFSFHRPETLSDLLKATNTLRNNLKGFPSFDDTGFRTCQTSAIINLEDSFAQNKSRALIQMATGAGKTFTAITSVYRLLKNAKAKRILFLVDTKNLGEQAEEEFRKYKPNDDARLFPELYNVCRLSSSYIPKDAKVCISTIQRMYSILRGEELNESLEETSLNEIQLTDKKPKDVVYNEKYPPELFDFIFIDECHRSIYNIWQQVLDYFDAFLIGLTATPDKRTFSFFKQNVVSEYTHEQAIIDKVNVAGDIYTIETDITKKGSVILKQSIEKRDRLTRQKRWEQMDEDLSYNAHQLDRDIVNPSQIRTVIRTFKDQVFSDMFPTRKELPKTLIFAKTDSHADDIIQIVREEFGEGNEFCKKITYNADNPKIALAEFRKGYNPRIAVTVDMIATGTDVKPIECLLFMRDVRSRNYFEQMKGRGTRTLSKDELQDVSPSATENKDHFVIVDAVGVTKSHKTDSRPLERKPTVSLKDLMMSVALGNRDEDTLTTLAGRLTRLDAQMSSKERKRFTEINGGKPINTVVQRLLDSFDEDVIETNSREQFGLSEAQEVTDEQRSDTRGKLTNEAAKPFDFPALREYIETVRKNHDQTIDNTNLDTVIFSGWDGQQAEKAEHTIKIFREFIEENKDEILALQIIYSQSYKNRALTLSMISELHEKLIARGLSTERLWESYAIKQPEKVKGRSSVRMLTDIVSLIRFELGYASELSPFADTVNYNFMRWTMAKNAGNVHFTDEQIDWLRMIKDHIAASMTVDPDDLDLTPFDAKGGLGRFYQIFGAKYLDVLKEMDEVLIA